MFTPKYLLIGAMVALSAAGCSSKKSDAEAAPLAVSGTIGQAPSSSSMREEGFGPIRDDYVSASAVDLSLYSVSCATTTAPVQTGKGTVAADGKFSVNIAGGINQPLNCSMVDSTDKKVADFVIADTAAKDLNGNSEVSSTAAYKANADLGTINYDVNAGEVNIPKANIAASVSTTVPAAASVFDPTGSWTIGPVEFTPPSGVGGPCAAGDRTCNGPPTGQTIYMKLWKGTKTADSSGVYGLQLWNSPANATACGDRIGLPPAVKTSLGVDFSANGAADNAFAYATSVPNFTDQVTHSTGTVTLTNYWKMSTATSQFAIQPNCGPHDITAGATTYANAWVCGPDSGAKYQAQLGGGCKDASNKNVQVRDWSALTCGSVTTDTDGIKTMTCSGNASVNGTSQAVTCSNKWTVTNASYVVQPGSNFVWSDMTAAQIASGTACSAIASAGSTNALKVAQLQCYSNYFYNSGMSQANACLPKVTLDWSATTPAAFEKTDLLRPEGLVFFEKFNPFPDGSGGNMLTRQDHYDGVQVKDSWVNCRVIESGGLSIKRISDTKLLATYQSSTITTSITKPACLAAYTGARQTFMFYLTK